MDEVQVRRLLAEGEGLAVEFKSDRGLLTDAELLETVVCLANAQGGVLLVGVEDDGVVTGLHQKHHTAPHHLAAFIAARTVPPLSVQVTFVNLPEGTVAVIEVPKANQPVATSNGKMTIRYRDSRGKPGCRPLYPYELPSWYGDRGLRDFTAQVVSGAEWDDLDPLEFERLRRMVRENPGGDTALLNLSNEALAGALGLVKRDETGRLRPTVAGLLIAGREHALRDYLPAHEVAFQVLHGTEVAVNEFRRWPLLHIHEWLTQAVDVRNEEQELLIDGVRIGVPRYDRAGIREAINNALVHRDYTRLGAIHVQLHDDHVRVSNPGGFVEGVGPHNLLVTEPRPRNPLLADIFKRVGLVERTGRGVETIYRGQLRNGRRPPDYTLSTEVSVSVLMDSGPADLDYVRLTVEAGRRLERGLALGELFALWQAHREGVTTLNMLAEALQRSPEQVAQVLEDLAREGLLDVSRGLYRIPSTLYARAQAAEPTRSPEERILAYVRQHGRITRREVMVLCDCTARQAEHRLSKLVRAGRLRLVGKGRNAHYVLSK